MKTDKFDKKITIINGNLYKFIFFVWYIGSFILIQTINAQNSMFLNPFHIAIDPMERLLLVNFEKDPDSLYVGFEPQVFDDHINGKGHLVIGWRIDGKVDVYHEPGLKPDHNKYDIAGKGLANMLEREMPVAFSEVNDFGLQAHYEFQDVNNRKVVIRVNENNSRKRKPFGLLAPMGDEAENPSAMPLILLHDFYFVRKKHSQIEISIDDKQHQADDLPMPLPIDGTKMTFVRYCPQPLIATFNPAFTGELPYISPEPGVEQILTENTHYYLVWKGEKPYINRIIYQNDVHPVELRFITPFPDINLLENGTRLKGRFEIEAHPATGSISGHYIVVKTDRLITIVMIPSKGWKPRPTKLSLRMLYTMGRIFKKWPATYKWTAVIQERVDESFFMESSWERIK
ncbi:MAG: hypothetical protein ACFCUM_12405 [Bacteroidales bacterium]